MANIKPILIFSFALLAISSFALSGCKHNQAKPKAAKAQTVSQTRVFLSNRCPIEKEEPKARLRQVETGGILETLLGIVGPTIIESGIGLVGEAISKAAGKDDETTFLSSSTDDYFYKNQYDNQNGVFVTTQDKSTRCLIFVDGEFGEGDHWNPGKSIGPLEEWDELNLLKIVGAPRFYMESWVVAPKGRSELAIQPVFIYYGEKLNHRGSDDSRDLEVRYTLSEPGTDSKNKGSEGSIIIKKLPVGSVVRKSVLLGSSTGVMRTPSKDSYFTTAETRRAQLIKDIRTLKSASKEKDKTKIDELESKIAILQCKKTSKKPNDCEKEQSAAQKIADLKTEKTRLEAVAALQQKENTLASEKKNPGPIYGGPTKFSVTVTETRDINKWLVAVGEALSAKKSDLSKELSKAVIPGLADSEEVQAAKDAVTAAATYQTAMLDVQIATLALTEAESKGEEQVILSAQKQLILKKSAANIAAISAGVPIPFPGL